MAIQVITIKVPLNKSVLKWICASVVYKRKAIATPNVVIDKTMDDIDPLPRPPFSISPAVIKWTMHPKC